MDRNREITRIKREEIRRLKEHLTLLQQRLERYTFFFWLLQRSAELSIFSWEICNLRLPFLHLLSLYSPFILFSPLRPSILVKVCVSSFLSGIWVMAQALRGFLWQMSSSMLWSLPPVSLCAPPQLKTLTHQHPLVAQQGSSCCHQGKRNYFCIYSIQFGLMLALLFWTEFTGVDSP